MTQLAPYYFDNELVSANIQRVGRASGDERFVFEVNVNDDELKSMVSETLRDFKDEIDRWHIDTPKETEVAEAVEGVEVPTTDEEHRSNWTTN